MAGILTEDGGAVAVMVVGTMARAVRGPRQALQIIRPPDTRVLDSAQHHADRPEITSYVLN